MSNRLKSIVAAYGVFSICMAGAAPPYPPAPAADTPADLRLNYYGDHPPPDSGSGGGWLFTTPDADGHRLWSQTRMMFGIGVVAVGVLYAMPSSITGWDRSVRIEEMPERWWNNVSSGPIWDNDHWFFNYVAHPYCGGVYFIMARKSGYNQWDAFLYTTIMSTFFWEYGIESFAEVPSIQDLIVTPLGGWIYGEWAFRREKAILANQGRVWGSKALGSVSLFLLDPIDHFAHWTNRLVGREWVVSGSVALAPAETDRTGGNLADRFEPRFTLSLARNL